MMLQVALPEPLLIEGVEPLDLLQSSSSLSSPHAPLAAWVLDHYRDAVLAQLQVKVVMPDSNADNQAPGDHQTTPDQHQHSSSQQQQQQQQPTPSTTRASHAMTTTNNNKQDYDNDDIVRSLQAANTRVVQASQAQLQHFACMSHEIRTPLNCIIGLSSLLLESKMTPMQEESIRMIVSSGDLLLTVVNDVLDYSKLESGHVEIDIRRSNLQETLNAIIHSIQTKAASKNIDVRTYYDPAVPEFCHTDCRRLQQILYNLLGNALKFSPADAPVELGVLLRPGRPDQGERPGEYFPGSDSFHTGHAENDDDSDGHLPVVTEEADETNDQGESSSSSYSPVTPNRNRKHHPSAFLHKRKSFCPSRPLEMNQEEDASSSDMVLRFVVKDYGQGLRPEDYKRIFEPFRQASRETETVYGGTGLGLAITSKLVNALGGTISVASHSGSWTRFTVDIPFSEPPVPTRQFTQALHRATVILVGPDGPDRAQVCHYFEAFGANYCVFDTSEQLDEACATEGFLQHGQSYICLMEETCYDEDAYALLAELAEAVLLTYGPNFSVPASNGHFRSLCQVLPSVLIKSMLTALKSRQTGGARRSLNRQSSFSAVQAMYHDYRILVAEDNKVNQKVLLRMLTRIGIEQVRVVDDGLEAVKAEREQYYDVILMDMQMPNLDGIGACKQILSRRGRGMERAPSIIFVTANVSPSFESACNDAGGSGFLSKPFSIPDLENTLRKTYLRRELEVDDSSSESTIELSDAS